MRLIDADAAIDAVVGCTNCGNEDELRAYVTKHSLENGWTGGIVDALDAIEQLPSVQPEQRWIPVAEALPEEETDVLVTRTFLGCKDGSHGWNNHIPPSTYVEVAQYFNGEWTVLSDEYKIARNRHTNPVAWMPLPEPYQEGGEQS